MSKRLALLLVAVAVGAALLARMFPMFLLTDEATPQVEPTLSESMEPISEESTIAPTEESTQTESPKPAELPDGEHVDQSVLSSSKVNSADLSAVDMEDPDAVADAFMETVAVVDTRSDISWMDAFRRAAPLMTQDLAEAVGTEIPGGQDAQWLELEEHEGYTTVDKVTAVDEDVAPEDTSTTALRVRMATRKSHGRDNWQGQADAVVYYLTLTHTQEGWKVSQVS